LRLNWKRKGTIGLKNNLPQISMETQVDSSKIKEFVSRFTETNLPLNETILAKSRSILNSSDFPTTRDEKWKYTRLSKLSKLSLVQTFEVGELSNIPLKNQPVISIINGNIDAIPEVKGLKISRFSENSEEVDQVGQFISLEDETGLADVVLFPGNCKPIAHLSIGPYVVQGIVEEHHGVPVLSATKISNTQGNAALHKQEYSGGIS